ncbi:MAG TPA: hypothetical protein VNB49_11285 [Candidatus Dormibacteraeota bacterium]|nr:hypothetical protein [Candidatus Dormibacteraeota bacterium]
METAGSATRRIEPDRGNARDRSSIGVLGLHPAWQALIGLCRDLRHGEIERIKIQDGLPVSAEVVRKKIRWF